MSKPRKGATAPAVETTPATETLEMFAAATCALCKTDDKVTGLILSTKERVKPSFAIENGKVMFSGFKSLDAQFGKASDEHIAFFSPKIIGDSEFEALLNACQKQGIVIN
jgi:hypothetical protein